MAAVPLFMLLDDMIACGVNNSDVFFGKLSEKKFPVMCYQTHVWKKYGKYIEYIYQDLKYYSYLTQSQDQIRLMTGVKRNIQNFIQ